LKDGGLRPKEPRMIISLALLINFNLNVKPGIDFPRRVVRPAFRPPMENQIIGNRIQKFLPAIYQNRAAKERLDSIP
jgi:hypothetical protein